MAERPMDRGLQVEILAQVARDLDATHRTLSHAQIRLVLEMIDAAGWEVVSSPWDSWLRWLRFRRRLRRLKRLVERRARVPRRRFWHGPVPVTIPHDQLVAVMDHRQRRGEASA